MQQQHVSLRRTLKHQQKYTENVLGGVVHGLADAYHLGQVVVGVVGMDHAVLDRHIVATEDLYGIATGMMKLADIVDDAINTNFGRFQTAQRTDFVGSAAGHVRCCRRLCRRHHRCFGNIARVLLALA